MGFDIFAVVYFVRQLNCTNRKQLEFFKMRLFLVLLNRCKFEKLQLAIKSLMMIVVTALFTGCGMVNQSGDSQFDYINPLVEQRADPWIHKDTDGSYYFIATSPKFDRIMLRSSKTINGLSSATEKEIWRKHESGEMSEHIWAPELHKLDGKWYVYFAASSVENKWHIRVYALSNASANPMEGEWIEEGQIKTGWENFALDATVFEHKGKRYMIWAQANKEWEYNSALWLAEMTSPTSIDTSKIIAITKPTEFWETSKYKVNEGAAVLIRNGKIFVTYSANATDDNYAMGLLWADVDADLMDVNAWNKSKEPVFYTDAGLKRFGPGHNSFTVAEDGKTDLLIYHARYYRELVGNPLTDPNRHTRVRVITWDENGFPNFNQSLDD